MLHAIEWILFGAASVTAVIVGVKRHKPARTGPWLLLGCAIAGMSLGDVLYALAWFTVADLFYLSMFFTVALSMMQLTRGGALLKDRARLIDLLSCACTALLVVWVFMINQEGEIGEISAANVIGSLLLLGVAGRLVAAAWFNWSAILLLVGAVGMLIGDVVYPLLPGPLAETGYIVLYVAWGAAALHPSMVRLTMPMPVRPAPWRGHWAVLLGLSVATPPAVLLIEALSGQVEDGVVIAVAGGLTLMLTFTRLADSVSLNSKALTRERVLREASTALVAASDKASVDEAVRSAVKQLLPSRGVDRVVFTTDDRQLTVQSLPAAPTDPRPRSWWLDDKAKKHDPGTGDATLICPLWLEPLAVARPSGGALVLSGRRDMLTANRDALEVLAGQAALALDRISLVEAVGRRDSDLYLRAVIRNTADIMLVIDEDQQIRYASPALRELIGEEELPPFATLQDIVHPDDRSQVRTALRDQGDGVVYCSLQRADQTQVYVEATYRDLREDRLVQGFVVTMHNVTDAQEAIDRLRHRDNLDELPAWINRRSAQHKFRY